MEGLHRPARSPPVLECSSIDDSDLLAPMALSVLEASGRLQLCNRRASVTFQANAPTLTWTARSTS